MRADVDGIDVPAALRHAPAHPCIDGLGRVRRNQAPPDAGLIGDDDDAPLGTVLVKARQGLERAGDEDDVIENPHIVGPVFDQDPIAVEEESGSELHRHDYSAPA